MRDFSAPDPSLSDAWGLGALPAAAHRRGGRARPRPGDVPQLSAWAATPSALGLRARAVLLAGQGFGPAQVAGALGVSRQTVHTWSRRYDLEGLAGLVDRVRPPARPVDDAAIAAATVVPPPRALGLTHWSARSLGAHLGVGHSTVARAWEAHGVRPHGLGTFRFATSPALVAHVSDVVGVVVARDLRLVAVSTVPAGSTRGTRHHAPAGLVAGDPVAEAGHGPLRAYAALRAAAERRPGRHRPTAADAVRRVLDARLPARHPDRHHQLALVGDRPDVADLPELQAWRRAHPWAVVRHVEGSEQWLRTVELLLRLAEVGPVGRGAGGCAPELATALRRLVAGDLVVPGGFAWADPAWRRPLARRAG
ncbi:helix-turn-helix domain-containing protein [Nocardioides litoris]|uniref:helix-turn-helix domain-containing protein n=1 Tax=Nocardioides litoris TaxID=1926648 RepID=UPI0014774BDC|nr:helix-turn-helix domain-containing protein [Nocardioides litoris]